MDKKRLDIGNSYYSLRVELGKWINPVYLIDNVNKQVYAQGEYSYSIKLDECISRGLLYNRHSFHKYKGKNILTLEGTLEFDNSLVKDIKIIHQFTMYKNQPYLDEKIIVLHRGSHSHVIEDICFGFRKPIIEPYARRKSRGVKDIEGFQFVAIPFGHLPNPSAPPLKPNPHTVLRLQDIGFQANKFGAEGWVWANQNRGMVVCKYSPDKIEHSILQSEQIGKVIGVRFGGASIWRGDTESARSIGPSGRLEFGVTRYIFYKGDWKEGFYRFRKYMSSLGHRIPENYNPPLNYCSWYDYQNNYDRKKILKLAKLVSDLGCELLYLDQGWDKRLGSSIWDTKKMGRLDKLIQSLKYEFGLDMGLHIMSDVYNLNEFPGCYRKDKDGREYLCDWLWGICYGSEKWRREKSKRLINLVKQGIGFLSFDFHLWAHDLNNQQACYDRSHGHGIPLTRQEHCCGLVEIVQNIHKECPDVLIEMHDPILSGRPARYVPYHYLHGLPNSFEEVWGSEFMFDPLKDILSGDALSLYYYNLAYELPLYLHIDMGKDNENLLQFWWFASTVRHLGIGGMKDMSGEKFQRVKEAVAKYLKLKKFFATGRFWGIDEYTHIHTLPEENEAVICVFNLTSASVIKELEFSIHDIGFNKKSFTISGGHAFSLNKGRMRISVKCNPLSPSILEIRTGNTE